MKSNEQRVWRDIAQLADAYLAAESDAAPLHACPPETLAAEPVFALGPDGVSHEEWINRLRTIMAATPSSSHPRFVNQLFGGRIPEAVAADALALLANSSMYTYKAAGAQVIVESAVLARLLAAAEMPGGEGSFTPGGSAANLAALLLARTRAFPQIRDEGADGLRATVYTSAESHYSIRKNAGILGLGRNQVRMVPVLADGRMDLDALSASMAADEAAGYVPLAVNATAGTTVRGAFDDIRGVAGVASRYGAWLHVDGALGASLLLSPTWRARLDGIELADSLAWNPHKMMGVALQTSVLLVRQRGSLAASLDETAGYLFQAHGDHYNPGHASLQCGRRNDAFRLWSAWCRLGDRGWADRIDAQMALAQEAARMIAEDPLLELLEPPPSVNVCFNLRGVAPETVCTRLNEKGTLKIGYGQVGERTGIRLVCVNPALGRSGLVRVLDAVKAAASSSHAGP